MVKTLEECNIFLIVQKSSLHIFAPPIFHTDSKNVNQMSVNVPKFCVYNTYEILAQTQLQLACYLLSQNSIVNHEDMADYKVSRKIENMST